MAKKLHTKIWLNNLTPEVLSAEVGIVFHHDGEKYVADDIEIFYVEYASFEDALAQYPGEKRFVDVAKNKLDFMSFEFLEPQEGEEEQGDQDFLEKKDGEENVCTKMFAGPKHKKHHAARKNKKTVFKNKSRV